MSQTEQEFLTGLEKKLWTAADKLRSTLDAAQYKHTVLGLIFLKYVSDSFEMRREEVEIMLRDEDHDYGVIRSNYSSDEEYEATIQDELEIRDYYAEENVFWMPSEARWQFLQDNNKAVIGGELEVGEGKAKKKIRSVGALIDNALDTVERDNPKLKNILNKQYTRLQIDQAKLGELIDLIATVPFEHESLGSKDILGHVYEYFLGQFALAEGKKGGQYYTPKSIVTLIVEMLEPFKGRVYDPAMGSGGFFVQSERFIEDNQGKVADVSIFGQEYNHTTWQLAAMNMAIRGLDFNFGKEPADTFASDQHPDLRADYVMANPPFNMKEWNVGLAEDDPRWVYGTPPPNNANFAWLQHMLYHLAPKGSLGLLLSNGSMSSNTNNEGDIRKSLIENDLVECMVALPGQLFTNTQIPACIWFLTRNKKAGDDKSGRKHRDRSGEVLFIDARNLGYMKDRVLRDFKLEDIEHVADTFHNWKAGDNYEDVAGFCKSATLEEISKHDFVLTPGRYVGAAAEEDDGEPFTDKMERLTGRLKEQFEESERLKGQIKENLTGLGFDVDQLNLWVSGGGSVPAHWEFSTIEELLETPKSISVGVMYPGPDTLGGVPLIRVADVKAGRVASQPEFCIADEVDEEYKRTRLNGSELLITLVGNPGDCVIVTEDMAGWNAARALAVLRLKDPGLRPWLRYVLLSKPAKYLIDSRLNTTVQKTLNLKDIKELSVPIAPKEERDHIAGMISVLESKSLINLQINQALEQIAQANFKSWFVDFEPVKAKQHVLALGGNDEQTERAAQAVIAGALNLDVIGTAADLIALDQQLAEALREKLAHQTVAQREQLATTASHFPDQLVESELGMIPEGWEVRTIDDAVGIVGGATPSTKNEEFWDGGTISWTSPKDLSGLTDKVLLKTARRITEAGLEKISSGLLPINTVLMSSRAPVGYLALARIPVAINQGYIAMKCTSRLPPEYVIQWANSIMDDIKGRASGTTFAEISKKNFRIIPLIIPGAHEVEAYLNLSAPLYEAIAANAEEILTLEKLRDALLPKLLSGEISVEKVA